MVHFLNGRVSDRKLRLFAVACCRRFWSIMEVDAISRDAVETVERFVDGRATVKECRLARASVGVRFGPGTGKVVCAARRLAKAALEPNAVRAASDASSQAAFLTGSIARESEMRYAEASAAERCAIANERQQQAALLRYIVGNPFDPVTVHPSWLTSDVMLLARGIYDEKAFDRMPILADALEDAVCTNNDMLISLRHGTDHARGCWILDAILGKG